MSTFTVADAAQLDTALSAVRSGDTILLEPGDYGDLRCKYRYFDDTVTIRSTDPANPATFGRIFVGDSSHMTFENVEVAMQVDETTTELQEGFSIYNASHIAIVDSKVIGGNAIAGIDPDSAPGSQGIEGITGYPIGRGIEIASSTDITVSGTEITDFNRGMTLGLSKRIVLTGNDFHDLRSTPIAARGVDDVIVEKSKFSEIHSWSLGGTGDHSDFIHFYTSRNQEEDSRNITIRDNFFEQGSGDTIMAIYFSTFDDGAEFQNVVIDNNVFHTSEYNAIRLGDIDGLRLTNNTLLPVNSINHDAPGIVLTDEIRNALIQNNVISRIAGEPVDEAAARNIVVDDNFFVQALNPLEDRYVGDLFADPMAENASLGDLRPVPGGAADGYGADFATVGPGTTFENWVIGSDHGAGRDVNLHHLSVLSVLEGLPDASDVSVTWDLGGETRTGVETTYRFETAGTTVVTATISSADDGPIEIDKHLAVQTPVALRADFADGTRDLSGLENESALSGGAVHVGSGEDGRVALRSADAIVAYETTAELSENPEFTVSFGFRKDASSLGEAGFAFYYSGTAAVKLGSDYVHLFGGTDAGERFVLQGKGLAVNDTDWHQVTYTFSQDDGTATLYVDGAAVDAVTGLTGAQYVTRGHDLKLGVEGASMIGEYDDLTFLRYDLDADEVAEGYAAFRGESVPAETFDDDASRDQTDELQQSPDPERSPEPEPDPVAPTPDANAASDPVAFAASFDGMARDLSTYATPVTMTGGASIGKSSGEWTMRLDSQDAQVAYETSEAMTGNTEFTISFDIRKDAVDATGFAFYYSGTAAVKVGEDFVKLYGSTDDGEKISLGGDGLMNDTGWHQITYSFSQTAGTATLYVDGAEVDHVTGLTGAQNVTRGHDMKLGLQGRSLTGEYDDLVMLQTALDADEAAELYADNIPLFDADGTLAVDGFDFI